MNTAKAPVNDEKLVAYCGLYCGACGKFLKGKCPGCAENAKASWCGVRKCGIESKHESCAECKKFSSVTDCKDYNNPISKIFGFLFRSDRKACVDRIKSVGRKEFAREMAAAKKQSIRR